MSMICDCGEKLNCVDTRRIQNNFVRRRYFCLSCNVKFTTVEHIIILKGRRNSSKKQMEMQISEKSKNYINKIKEYLNKLEGEILCE